MYIPTGAFLEDRSEAEWAVRALIQEQRRLANSPNLTERFRVLWIAARLDLQLMRCTDHEIGQLMAIVQNRFGLFEAEFAICHHARTRLMGSTGKVCNR